MAKKLDIGVDEIVLTSVQNPVVKEVVALRGKKDALAKIILEGEKSLLGALGAGLGLEAVFYEDEKYGAKFSAAATKYRVNEKILEKISSTKSPAPVVGVAKRPIVTAEELKKLNKILVLEDIKDPGNLGTIIRSAVAFGMDGIFLTGDCVDPYSSKVIRASVGTIFKIPVAAVADDFKEFKKTHAFISTVVKGGESLNTAKFPAKFLLFFGSEADGLSSKLQALADKKITLKMDNTVESLNLSVSAGIVLHQIFNQS